MTWISSRRPRSHGSSFRSNSFSRYELGRTGTQTGAAINCTVQIAAPDAPHAPHTPNTCLQSEMYRRLAAILARNSACLRRHCSFLTRMASSLPTMDWSRISRSVAACAPPVLRMELSNAEPTTSSNTRRHRRTAAVNTNDAPSDARLPVDADYLAWKCPASCAVAPLVTANSQRTPR